MKFHSRWAATALCIAALSTPSFSHAAAISGQGTWETTLQGRDLDGNLSTAEAYYDTALGITWLANANYAGTQMDWSTANAWASSLDIYSVTGWRLPTMTDTGTPGCNFSHNGTDCGYNVETATSEMAHMFYITLGNKAIFDTSGSTVPQEDWGLTNTGPFSNIVPDAYWFATEYAPDTSQAFYFINNDGFQSHVSKTLPYLYAWAVHPGDIGVSTVPVPAAVWLFGSGLIGLIGMSRECRRRSFSHSGSSVLVKT
jgi:hypothetical protein